MESPTAVWNEYLKQRDLGEKLMPDLIKIKNALTGEAYKEGALSTKHKRLMALAVGLRAGCELCVIGQPCSPFRRATKEEIFESISVAPRWAVPLASPSQIVSWRC